MLEHLVERGYAPKGGLLSPKGVFYLNIPKNASTYMTNLLLSNGWIHSTTDADMNQVIVILRDPVERWISGFATYATSWICSAGYGSDHFVQDYTALAERIIFDQIVFDDHTTPQVKFIQQLDQSIPITYFKLNADLGRNLENFLDCQLGLNTPIERNLGEDIYDTKNIARHMRWRIQQDPELQAKIIKCYHMDYELIRTASYYYEPR